MWKPLSIQPDYEISESGIIRNTKTGYIVSRDLNHSKVYQFGKRIVVNIQKSIQSHFPENIQIIPGEIWKVIPGYEGIYMISSIGRLKSLSRPSRNNRGIFNTTETIFTQCKLNSTGYFQMRLTKNNRSICFKAHRLVAMAFIANPENKPYINHKNGIKTDNRVENLEWCTPKENSIHASLTGLLRPSKFKGLTNVSGACKPVLKLDLSGNFIKRYPSLSEASRDMNVRMCSITDAIYGKCHTCKGFKWQYESLSKKS